MGIRAPVASPCLGRLPLPPPAPAGQGAAAEGQQGERGRLGDRWRGGQGEVAQLDGVDNRQLIMREDDLLAGRVGGEGADCELTEGAALRAAVRRVGGSGQRDAVPRRRRGRILKPVQFRLFGQQPDVIADGLAGFGNRRKSSGSSITTTTRSVSILHHSNWYTWPTVSALIVRVNRALLIARDESSVW